MQATFDYGLARIRDLNVSSERNAAGRMQIKSVEIAGEEARPTKRFWKSLFTRFGISDNVFRYFEPEEVFSRISQRAANDQVRYCLERNKEGNRSLLAVSNPKRPLITYDEVSHTVGKYGFDLTYDGGIVTSTHTPRSGEAAFKIGGDKFQHRFVMETRVDGFSHPKIYLSFLRLVCSNGAIGYSRAFRSDVSLGKDIGYCITRALESYDNGEGYAALRQRFESAQTSWASLRECLDLYKALSKLKLDGHTKKDSLFADFSRLTGNLTQMYGLANLDALSVKRQRVLPSKCRIYDLLNFASEVATHHTNPQGSRVMQAFLGGLISDEYDLEGTATDSTDFSDFFISSGDAGPQASLN